MTQGYTKGVPIDTDPLMALNSNQVVPSQAAVVTYVANNATKTLTSNSGTATVSSSNIDVLGSGSVRTTAASNALTIGLTGVTQYNVQTGGASNVLNNVAPSATSGVPLISQGASTQPVFGTAVVAGGGTGNTTFTAYSVICAGTTATGAFQNVSGVGTANQFLVSNGAGALPTWQAKTAGVTVFFAYKSASTANVTGDSTIYTIVCDTEIIDAGANYNSGTGTFTAPVTGTYALGCVSAMSNIQVAHTTGNQRIATSNRTYRTLGFFNPANYKNVNNDVSTGGFIFADMDLGDTATTDVNVANGTKVVGVSGSTVMITTFYGNLLV